jgi:hypothetical protein
MDCHQPQKENQSLMVNFENERLHKQSVLIDTLGKHINVSSLNKMYFVEMHVYNVKIGNHNPRMQHWNYHTKKYSCILSVNKPFNSDQQSWIFGKKSLHTLIRPILKHGVENFQMHFF